MNVLTFMLLFGFALLVSSFVMARNCWVFKNRGNIKYFNKLPSYDQMMAHFWIWNLEKFEKNRKGG